MCGDTHTDTDSEFKNPGVKRPHTRTRTRSFRARTHAEWGFFTLKHTAGVSVNDYSRHAGFYYAPPRPRDYRACMLGR